MFTNIDTVYQKGKSKQNVMEEANISPISEKRRLTQLTRMRNKKTVPTEIYILEENKNVSDLSRQGEYLAGITPDNLRIPRKNKRSKTPDTLVIRK